MKKSNKIKTTTAIVVVIAILGTAGTFAWTSMSQRALNEGSVTHSPGGRVHDDYEGFDKIISGNGGTVNKDIFAENYSNKPIFTRVKLTEYMEVGPGAGKYEVTGQDHIMKPTSENTSKPLANAGLDKANMSDRSTWPAYLPNGELNGSVKSDLRDYITWSLGDKNNDRKVYMPTFNQNNENLESDTTGIGIEELTWSLNKDYDTAQNPLPGTQDQWKLNEKHISNLRSYEYTGNKEVVTNGVTHTAVETIKPGRNNGYMTMSDWKIANKPTGNFWVHDNDGWIYWANPIAANSATSLLLDKFDVTFPKDDMYYAINVISDFATVNDLDKWENVSSDAESLIATFK